MRLWTASADRAVDSEGSPSQEISPISEAIAHCVEALQRQFGPRIERILGAGGGLLVVMDRVDGVSDRFTGELSQGVARELGIEVPIALIDHLTLNSLRRLGKASPIQEEQTYFDAADAETTTSLEPPLLTHAKERVRAAEVLIEQQCPAPAMELLVSALLAAAAVRAGKDQAPSPQEAGGWIYGEAMPTGLLYDSQAALIMRAIGLSQAPAVPENLLATLLEESWVFVLETKLSGSM